MSIIVVKWTGSGRPMTKIKEIIYCEKRASSKTDNIYDTPEDRFHNVFSFRPCHGPRGIIPFLTISTCCQLNEQVLNNRADEGFFWEAISLLKEARYVIGGIIDAKGKAL